VQFFAAYASLAVTLGLVVSRPRVTPRFRIGPAPAAAVGVLMMLAARVVSFADLSGALQVLWRPLVAIVSIMVTTAAAKHVGLLDRLASILFAHTHGSASRVFLRVFVLSALTAAMLNNDSAVLLLTPAVIALVRRRYPNRPALVVPFAFAVFMAAGVAPLVLSNPMNMIFAAYAGIDFNRYAMMMAPISIAGCLIAACALRLVFRRALLDAPDTTSTEAPRPLDAPQVRMLVVLAAVLGTCPFVAYVGGPVWIVASLGALAALFLVPAQKSASPVLIVRDGISWEIVAFLVLVSVLGVGLRNVGLVAHLSAIYASGSVGVIGVVSAAGSALLNNHPMSIMNMLALEQTGLQKHVLAALIGGDLGPRLLPMGSLAGLLWIDALRRMNVEVSFKDFVRVGAAITIPTLAVSLAMLSVM
jgi:arsenical pump membrane protein